MLDFDKADWSDDVLRHSPEERLLHKARHLRNARMAEVIQAGARRAGLVLAAMLAPVRAWQECQRIEAELNALSDRELADYGLRRADIARVADGTYWAAQGVRAPGIAMPGVLVPGPLAKLAHAVTGWARAWHERRLMEQELVGMSDRELADIGISRSDIQRIAWENART